MRAMLRWLTLVADFALLAVGLWPGWAVEQSPGHTTQHVAAGLWSSPLVRWQNRSFDPDWFHAEIDAGRSASARAGTSITFEFVSLSAACVAVGVALLALRRRLGRLQGPSGQRRAEPDAAAGRREHVGVPRSIGSVAPRG
jgi:hypothetical protein